MHFFEDVIIRTTHKNPRLGDIRLLDELKVLFVGADPRRDLGKFEPRVLACLQRLLVLFGVDKELRLADKPLGSAQTGHELIQIDDLLDGEGRGGLLPVAESRVRHPDLIGHVDGHMAVVEHDLGDALIVEQLAEQLRLLDVLQFVVIDRIFQQVGFLVEIDHGGSFARKIAARRILFHIFYQNGRILSSNAHVIAHAPFALQ